MSEQGIEKKLLTRHRRLLMNMIHSGLQLSLNKPILYYDSHLFNFLTLLLR